MKTLKLSTETIEAIEKARNRIKQKLFLTEEEAKRKLKI